MHDPSDEQVMVHMSPFAPGGIALACVHVLPPSAVLRNVPVGGVVGLAPAALLLTLITQCGPSAQLILPT
jgi:hypothetical protein